MITEFSHKILPHKASSVKICLENEAQVGNGVEVSPAGHVVAGRCITDVQNGAEHQLR